MANIIYNNITIEPEEAMDKVCKIFDDIKGDTTSIVKAFYTEEDLRKPYNNGETEYPITDNGVLNSWLYDNVGTKWITGGNDYGIKLETANYPPDGFLIKLYQICNEEFDDVRIICKWYDECATNIGTSFIKDGVYTEDEETLEDENISDPAYEPTGEEDIDDVKDWILGEITEDSSTKEEEVEEMDDEQLRELFEDWKRQGKWDQISDRQESMYYSCEEAIDTDDMEFPISKVKRIATKKFDMIENCYPFKN